MQIERIQIPKSIYNGDAETTTARIKGTITPDAVAREEERRERKDASQDSQNKQPKDDEVVAASLPEVTTTPVAGEPPRLDVRA